jgi:hypothetical protein
LKLVAVFATVRRESALSALLLVALLSALGLEALQRLIGAQGRTLFWQEFGVGDGPVAWLMLVLEVMAVPLLRFSRAWNGEYCRLFLEKRVMWVCLSSALFYAVLMRFAAFGLAYTPDESSAVLQAQTFAALQLTPRVAPDLVTSVIPAWLQNNILLFSPETGRYTPTYWPGYALLMAPFARFGLEWLCNPVLTALSLGLLFKLTARWLGSRQAGVWALVWAFASPVIALNAATFFSMPAHLLANLLFCWFFTQNTRRAAFFAGLVGGFALILHNPVPHLSFALPWILWAWKSRRAQFGPLLLGYALVALPVGIGWSIHLASFQSLPAAIEGAARVAATSQESALSRLVARVAFVFRPPDRYLLLSRLAGLVKIGVWAAPGLIVFAWLGWRRVAALKRSPDAASENNDSEEVSGEVSARDRNSYLWLLGASVATNFGIYLFIRFDQGHGWGFRYMHQTWLAWPILAAFLIQHEKKRAGFSLRRLSALFCLLSVLVVLPLRVVQARLFMQNVLRDRPPAAPPGAAISFVRESEGEAATFITNDPFLRNSQWKLRFLSQAKSQQVARRYLASARRVQVGKWGETWSGTHFQTPSPPVETPSALTMSSFRKPPNSKRKR